MSTSLNRDRLSSLDRAAIWVPQPGPQLQAFVSKADQLLVGGAAGGGKTSLGLGLALTAHRRTLFVRREGLQLLPVIDEIAVIVGTRDGYNGANHTWRLPGGRQLQFGGVPNAGDETRFQGNPHDLLVLDEAANLLELQARFLLGWVRSTDPRQRCRALLCSNPPTSAEGEWLIRWFAPWLDKGFPKRASPGELRWVAMIPGEGERWVDGPEPFRHGHELIRPVSRTFIPSRVSDNRYLASTGYATTLAMLPEPLRSQMLLGDFTAGREDAAMQVIPSEWVRAAQARWKARSKPATPMTALGVDVARGGKDRTVLTPRWDAYFGQQVIEPGRDTPDGPAVAALVLQHRRDAALINVDVIGAGASVFDHLHATLGDAVAAMNGAEGSDGRDKSGRLTFANKRAEWWWGMREALDPDGGQELALPPDPGLLADLCAPTWKLTARGIQVEGEDVIKRLGRSPDRGDSAVYALARESPISAVFAYDRKTNELTALPMSTEPLQTVIGCRRGRTGDAIGVIAWERESPAVYLSYEWAGPKQTMTQLAQLLRAAIEKYKPLATVVDAGELGAPAVNELCSRFRLPLATAEAKERLAAIELINDAMRGGRFFARSDGLFARDIQRLEWSRSGTGKPEIVGASAICDAVIAAYLSAQAWLYRPPEVRPRPGTPEWEVALRKKLFERAQREVRAQKDYPLGDFAGDLGVEVDTNPFGLDLTNDFGWPDPSDPFLG